MKHISEANWSIGKKIYGKFKEIAEAKSKREVELICLDALGNMKGKDVREFKYSLYNCQNLDAAITFCYNYYFAGLGLRAY